MVVIYHKVIVKISADFLCGCHRGVDRILPAAREIGRQKIRLNTCSNSELCPDTLFFGSHLSNILNMFVNVVLHFFHCFGKITYLVLAAYINRRKGSFFLGVLDIIRCNVRQLVDRLNDRPCNNNDKYNTYHYSNKNEKHRKHYDKIMLMSLYIIHRQIDTHHRDIISVIVENGHSRYNEPAIGFFVINIRIYTFFGMIGNINVV